MSIQDSAVSKNGILLTICVIAGIAMVGVFEMQSNTVNILGFCAVICTSLFNLLAQNKTNDKLDVNTKSVTDVATEQKETTATVSKAAAAIVKLGRQTDAAAENVEQVKTDLIETNAQTAKTMENLTSIAIGTHQLVNSQMSLALKHIAELARKVAEGSKNPADELAANLAEQAFKDHELKQQIVDVSNHKAAVDAKIIKDDKASLVVPPLPPFPHD